MLRTILLISVLSLVQTLSGLRICSNFLDYYAPFSSDCYDDPTAKFNTSQIIRSWGFKSEEILIKTEDGFEIVLNRGYQNITKRNPVILVHGIGMSSLGFAYREKESLPYLLGILGYDVYIINCRGTEYSPISEVESNKPAGFHEMAIYDLRDSIKYIKRTTNQKLLYIGFSMGTTMSYIYSSVFPEEAAENLQGIVSMAPVEYLTGAKSFAVKFHKILSKLLPLTNSVNNPNSLSLLTDFCAKDAITMLICVSLTAPIFGDDFDQLYTPTLTPRSFKMGFDAIPPDTINHYFQMMDSNKFQYFDYGPKKNSQIYKQKNPPLYQMKNIKVPISYFVGENDWLASKENAEKSFQEVPIKCGYHIVPYKKWCHSDFVNAKDIYNLLYKDVIKKINVMADNGCTNEL